MDPQTYEELLASTGFSTATRNSTYVYAERNVFEPAFEMEPPLFQKGINVHYMHQLLDVQRNRPHVRTDAATPRLYKSDLPVPVYNTGTLPLQPGQTLTVAPVMCKKDRTPTCMCVYLLETHERQRYTREAQEVFVWLRIFLDMKTGINVPVTTSSKPYWRALSNLVEPDMANNSMWQDLLASVRKETTARDTGDVYREMYEVVERHWAAYLGGGLTDSAVNAPALFRGPVLTSASVLNDLREGLDRAAAVDPAHFQAFGNQNADDIIQATTALSRAVGQHKTVQKSLYALQGFTRVFEPIVAGRVQSASSISIKPGELMDVIITDYA